jgi:hypothetical protein
MTGMIVLAILDLAGISNTDFSNTGISNSKEILTSILAKIYWQNIKSAYETVGDAIIGSLVATSMAVVSSIIGGITNTGITGTLSIPKLVASFERPDLDLGDLSSILVYGVRVCGRSWGTSTGLRHEDLYR